jgi:hypothetical protein
MATKKNGKMVELPNTPPIHILATGATITPAAEKAQINTITVERGNPGTKSYTEHLIWKDNEIVKGVNPFQGQFIFNLVTGALGSGRGQRPTAFAAWAVQVSEEFNEHAMLKPLLRYNVIVDYQRRGGTVVYPVKDMLALCDIKRKNILNSIERFPPDVKTPQTRPRKTKAVEVSLTL